jgi:7-cyano-7-deazaguanine synthase
MLELATQNRPQVHSPTIDLTKREIAALGVEIGAPLHLTWSCYGDGPTHCWECPSCRRLQGALRESGHWEQWAEQQPPADG